ncbi:uncharacterized protein LOC105437907 isoform X1 [Strongylocentrotus purpuratus]|uniref:Farnesoic acid O-methyl transferase domain-containing protein n=1 Tax=Strongylocentrotus purpuratus TaxID=7668 RepID=A0A7M7N408_STRPU|nr:uncharacterized protein LOC105437907 isoform X1 [Strongylocentrotus purpuratus]
MTGFWGNVLFRFGILSCHYAMLSSYLICFLDQIYYPIVLTVINGTGLPGVHAQSCHERPEDALTRFFRLRCGRSLLSNDSMIASERDLAPWIPKGWGIRIRRQHDVCSVLAPTPPLDDRDFHGSIAQSGNFTGDIHLRTTRCNIGKFPFDQLPPVPADKYMNLRIRFSTLSVGMTVIALAERSTLHTAYSTSEPIYSICIGRRSHHSIYRCKAGCVVRWQRNPFYGLSINRTMSILVTYEQGVIKVFDDNDRTPFMTYTDPHPLTIRHVAICKYTTEGRFVLHICDSY